MNGPLFNRTALVLGLGESGLAMARHLAREGATLRVADTRLAPPQLAALREHVPQASFVSGPFDAALLDGIDLLALSPGLSPTHSAAKPVVEAATKAKIEIVGEIELFAAALARLRAERGYEPKVIGITGTNGKTTTTRLTGLLIDSAGRSVAVAGNISPTALDALQEALAVDALPSTWVLELSSFQLATTRSLNCAAATVLNVTQDHLDWHGSLDEYAQAKATIFSKDTIQVLNRDDSRVINMARKGAQVVTFGMGAPNGHGHFGLVQDKGMTWLAFAEDAARKPRRRRTDGEPQAPAELFVHRLMPAEALALRGRHNAANVLAALALARAIDCPLAPMLHALRSYRGEPHRVQLIATIGAVQYYDDSKGTNVGATVAALDGLGGEGQKLVVILGGDGKGQDFGPLVAPLARFGRGVVVIGRDAATIAATLGQPPYPVESANSLSDAVRMAAQLAQPGDAVLLSPACASLDMFRNYIERAEVFADAVRDLGAEAGQPC